MKSWNNTIVQTLGRHPVHPFPARMAPGIALDALADHASPLRVLDPMMGSGTVLAVARSRGHRAYGCDLDPLAVLMAEVWTTTVDRQDILGATKTTLARARHLFGAMRTGAAYPSKSDEETRRFLRYWFDDYARRQLASLAVAIASVRRREVRNLLWVAFSRLIIAKQAGASRAMDLSHSRPHRAFDRAPTKPLRAFGSAVDRVMMSCPQRLPGTMLGPTAHARIGDARALEYRSGSFDMVITSPPYLNAIDYLRCSKFSLVWMGHSLRELRELRGIIVGSEASSAAANDDAQVNDILKALNLIPKPHASVVNRLRRYIHDIHRILAEITRVLRKGGRAIIVIGDSSMRGTFVRNSAIVTIAAERAGLQLEDCSRRELPPNRRYLPPPSNAGSGASLDGRMRQELVVSFRKS